MKVIWRCLSPFITVLFMYVVRIKIQIYESLIDGINFTRLWESLEIPDKGGHTKTPSLSKSLQIEDFPLNKCVFPPLLYRTIKSYWTDTWIYSSGARILWSR